MDEYILRATWDESGENTWDTRPYRREQPFQWAAGLSQLVLRARGQSNAVVRQYRRRAGSDEAWVEVVKDVADAGGGR